MEKRNIVMEKSLEFAILIVNQYKILTVDKKEFVMSKQFLRSGTSIGANVHEATNGFSKADFIFKMNLAQKECAETIYWLEILFQTEYLEQAIYNDLKQAVAELLRILRSIILTAKSTKDSEKKSN